MRPKLSFLIFCLLLSSCLISPAAAADVTLSFSDLHMVDNQEYEIYQVSGNSSTYLGTYNSTDTLDIDPTYNYHVVLKPSKMDWFEDPIHAIDLFLIETPGILGSMVWFIMLGGGLVLLLRAIFR